MGGYPNTPNTHFSRILAFLKNFTFTYYIIIITLLHYHYTYYLSVLTFLGGNFFLQKCPNIVLALVS